MDVPGKVTSRLALLARLALGLTFVVAAAAKLNAPSAFADAIARYHLVDGRLPAAIAVFIPPLELLCGIALLLGRAHRGALALTAGMGTVFTAALATAWVRGLDLSCGCFGSSPAAHGDVPFAFFRALAVALLAVGLLAHERRRLRSPESRS